MGQFLLDAGNADVDPGLLGWIRMAAENSPYNVRLQSGYREGDPRFHGKKMAIDVQLIDPQTGKVIPNYQTADSFAAYQGFANQVRAAQQQASPDAGNRLRWGGYFSGGKGKYGALDLMHFDIGGDTTPMGGGGWETGLTPEQAAMWGLSPGGGVSGGAASGPNSAPLAGVFDSALPQPETPLQSMASAFAKGVSAPRKSAPQGTGGVAADPLPETPMTDLETPTAVPQADTLGTPGGSPDPAPLASDLASLFDVKEIGMPQAQVGKPYVSPRRGF